MGERPVLGIMLTFSFQGVSAPRFEAAAPRHPTSGMPTRRSFFSGHECLAASALTLLFAQQSRRAKTARCAGKQVSSVTANSVPRARSNIPLNAVALHADTAFKLDVSRFTSEEAKERHVGECGDPPEVEILSRGEDGGVLAARGTIRVRYNARKIFESFCDPEENKRIFDNCASVNFRDLLHEDKVKKTRLFEVSKTGQWTLLGIPINFESTVLAMEDWKKYEISFKLKKQGAMKHMSGFWRVVPVSQDESIVLFYNEAVPFIRIPSMFKFFAGRLISEMAASLLEDLRRATKRWQKDEAEGRILVLNASEPGVDVENEQKTPSPVDS